MHLAAGAALGAVVLLLFALGIVSLFPTFVLLAAITAVILIQHRAADDARRRIERAAIERERENSTHEREATRTARAELVEALPDPVLEIDATRRIVAANRAARSLFAAEVGGELLGALRDPALIDAMDAVLRGGETTDVPLVHGGSVESFLVARVVGLAASHEAGPCALLAFHDVTALRRVDAMRADFVANVSHELRTPLAALLGFIETLRGPARDDADARARFLAIMHDEASRMSRLVADLLSLSRIEASEHTRPTDLVNLTNVINAAIDVLAPAARARGVRLRLDLPGDLPAVTGDGDQLRQVFQNLIDNAVKYSRTGGEVTITARRASRPGASDPGVIVSVIDQGEGIAREHIPRLTERFYRVDTARSRKLGGTGLGLAIVKHIINRHRGTLTITSESGRGAIFSVWLRNLV
jgi:two-component system phosphate regulon sensor histidine kinase PhoR